MTRQRNRLSINKWAFLACVTFIVACGDSTVEKLSYKEPTSESGSEVQHFKGPKKHEVYVPAYSHIYHQDGRPHPLTITLSVRNTSKRQGLTIESVIYHGSNGETLRQFLNKPLALKPLATTAFLVERSDTSGGVGASFIVVWSSSNEITEPIVESVMIDTSGQQGLSFARQGVEIR